MAMASTLGPRGARIARSRKRLAADRVSDEAAARIRAAERLIAVGTTAVRTVESFYKMGNAGQTNLFIYPGYEFQRVNAMVTNFHLPQSSLLLLVSAFAGHALTMAAYRHAVAERYRFFSYGDAMFIA